MVNADNWSVSERHMVTYHYTQLVWFSRVAIALLVGAFVAVLGVGLSTGIGLSLLPSASEWWNISFASAFVLTALAFGVKSLVLRRMDGAQGLCRAITLYRRAQITFMSICFAGGIIPSVVTFLQKTFTFHMLAVAVPLAAMLVFFPFSGRFEQFLDESAGGRGRGK